MGQLAQKMLGQFGEGQIEDQKPQEVPQTPVAMGIVREARKGGAAQFARPIDDVFNPKKEQQGRRFQALPSSGSPSFFCTALVSA